MCHASFPALFLCLHDTVFPALALRLISRSYGQVQLCYASFQCSGSGWIRVFFADLDPDPGFKSPDPDPIT